MSASLGLSVAGIEPGSIFGGKYRIEKMIGSGGMGVILSAMHMELEHRVAVKLLTAEAAADPERVGRFQREAKAAARIQSEHVVRILDYGTHTSGAPYIVMEHLEGADLAVAIKSRGGLPIDEALDYVLQACEGVAEAHHTGIIHRDLKPANLFLTRKKDGTPTVKVLDFGASKLTAECSLASSDAAKTHASALIGSPRYMAPEQLKAAHEIDARADVYAMGATIWELLAGEPVFKADSISRIFTKILWDAPPSIKQFRDDVPDALERVIETCLNKRPEDRYQTIKELVVALAPHAPPRTHVLVEQIARIGRVLSSVPPHARGPSASSTFSSPGAPAPPPAPPPAAGARPPASSARTPAAAPAAASPSGTAPTPAAATANATASTPESAGSLRRAANADLPTLPPRSATAQPAESTAPEPTSGAEAAAPARPAPLPVPPDPRGSAGSTSMDTMAVLRAARADGRRPTSMLFYVGAFVVVASVVGLLAYQRTHASGQASTPPSGTQAVVPSAGGERVPPVPPVAEGPATTATATAAGSASAPPATVAAEPPATSPTTVRHRSRHGASASAPAGAATAQAPTSPPSPAASATHGASAPAPFSEFGERK